MDPATHALHKECTAMSDCSLNFFADEEAKELAFKEMRQSAEAEPNR
jgi:hypothetical protein